MPIIDQINDGLVRGGETIYRLKVENTPYDHPDVVDAAVVDIPPPSWGEAPAAVVRLQPRGQAAEAEPKAWDASPLTAFKAPAPAAVWPQTPPRNADGEKPWAELKALFQGSRRWFSGPGDDAQACGDTPTDEAGS